MLRHWRPFLFGLFVGLLSSGLILLLGRPDEGVPVQLLPPPTPVPTATPRPLRVHVTGAVNAPGVYDLEPGANVSDALAAAGGATEDANLAGLNLALPLQDGAQLFVAEAASTVTEASEPPTESATPAASSVSTGQETASGSSDAPVDINTADAAQLETLPRIGPALAQRIVEYRQENGPFQSIEEIMNVRGIGDATFEGLRDLITVGS